MKKRILTVLLVVGIAVVGFIIYRMMSPLSPAGEANFDENGLKITVTYSRPYKKGRLIFGPKDQGALQPYGEYWRLGANAATEISFNKAVRFGNASVPAGTYRMYAIPGESVWKVALNSELGVSGATEPNHDLDVVTIEVPSSPVPSLNEQFTISFRPADRGASMEFEWDNVRISVPIALE